MNSNRRVDCALLTAVVFAAAVWGASKKETKPVLPKAGLKTPGVLIPVASLQAEASIAVDSSVTGVQFTDAAMIATASGIYRIESKTNKPAEPPVVLKLAKPCGGVLNAFRFLWVAACGTQDLSKIEARGGGFVGRRAGGRLAEPPASSTKEDSKQADPGAAKEAKEPAKEPAEPLRAATLKLDSSIPGAKPLAHTALAASEDSIWLLADEKTTLLRIDPKQNVIVSEMRLPAACTSILFGEGSLWVTCPGENRVIRIDPKTGLVTKRIDVAAEPYALALGESAIWVLGRKEGKISRVDPKTNKTVATIDLGIPNAAGTLAFGEGSLWASIPDFPLIRIVPVSEKERVLQQFYGDGGGLVSFGLGSVWVASAASNTVQRYDPKRVAATLAE